jgi:predicted esterase
MKRTFTAGVAFILFLPGAIRAQADQADRYQTGLRLRALEAALDAQPDPAARKRALESLKKATFVFLAQQTVDAGRMLDRARHCLDDDKGQDPAVAWADALAVRPEARLLDAGAPALAVTARPYYKADGPAPEKAALRLTLADAKGRPVTGPAEVPLAALPAEGKLPLRNTAEGDYVLRVEVTAAGRVLARCEQGVSLATRLDARLKALAEAVAGLPEMPRTTDGETLRTLTALLTGLRDRKTYETNYPAARLLREAEELAGAVRRGEEYYGPARRGQFWLTLACGGKATHARVQVPDGAAAGRPMPVVLALHGAGGSENLFFDCHGNGLAARLCAERGWLLVAPRGRPPEGLLDEVARLYPIDRGRVFVFGHSMGAATAVESAAKAPERFAAVAALGGGGGVRATERLRGVPFFVASGAEDFALPGARSLRDALQKAGVKKVEYHEYPDVEHLLVVQLGLKDVFAFFDAAARPGVNPRPKARQAP